MRKSPNPANNGKYKLSFFSFILLTAVLLVGFVLVLWTIDLHEKNEEHRDSSENSGPDETDTLLTINLEPVSVAEFYHVMSGLRISVYSYFLSKYGELNTLNFWNSDFNGEVPGDKLKQETINALKNIKVEQVLIREKGIADDISYYGFLQELRIENERRKNAINNRSPVYGPKQFEENIFYEYLQYQRREKFKKLLSESEFQFKEEEIRDYYNINKTKMFLLPGNIRIGRISMQLPANENNHTLHDHYSIMNQILENARKGKDFQEIVSDFQKIGTSSILYDELQINIESLKFFSNSLPGILEAVNNLQNNQISEIIVEMNTLNIIKIILKESGSYIPLDEARAQIMRDLREISYDQFIRTKSEKAVITIDEELFGLITF